MGIFNKILGKKGSHFFNKIGSDAVNIGKKISAGASNVLGTVGNVAGALASNPLVAGLAGPEANALFGGIANVARQGQGAINYKNYSGGPGQVANQLQKNITNTANSGSGLIAQ
jgi:hypothetical protein